MIVILFLLIVRQGILNLFIYQTSVEHLVLGWATVEVLTWFADVSNQTDKENRNSLEG